ncbi:hypothetical protein PCANC_05145 [Puccinia coronata f. sp. avenae]|uniref:Uncharacterized protein n=1 Tax=Puccinia coronata f. sp. avenae TaxID=200324 RepID=A0A2N5W356_9BASI|nr:hypothetical protein PCANC_05145 [Puccinia coronata f. sp. avenae]
MPVSASTLDHLDYHQLFANPEEGAPVGYGTYHAELPHIESEDPSLEPAPHQFTDFRGESTNEDHAPLGFVPFSSVVLYNDDQLWLYVRGVHKDGASFAIWSRDRNTYSQSIFVEQGKTKVIAIPQEVSRPKRLFFVPNYPATGSTVA